MDAVVQVLPLPVAAATAPSDVPAGDGGQAEGLFEDRSSGVPVGLVLLVTGVGLAVLGLRTSRPRG